MHSLAASSGMVASSGFRRIHSLSTFTARADWAKAECFCETQNVGWNQTLQPSQRGSWLDALLIGVSVFEPNHAGSWGRRHLEVGAPQRQGRAVWWERAEMLSWAHPTFLPYLGGHCENKRKVKTVRDRVILKNKLSRLGHTKFLSLLSPKNLIAQT